MHSTINIPTSAQLKEELRRERYKGRYSRALRGTVYSLIIVAAAAVLISSLFFPVLQVTGNSMTPTLSNENIVVLVKTIDFSPGSLCSFTWNNKTLIKRIIAKSGDWVNIDADGTVEVNNIALDEPYIENMSFGECDLTFPYQVPENSYFVMGDHRSTSIDSRSSVIGCVHADQIIGKVWLKVYPFDELGFIK